ncbi:MAG: DUF2975 domain-containing protein [Bacteroidaceae bacterium]|nr:DUF2975 domain-containing protein [Bacteroidaceae bacterium]
MKTKISKSLMGVVVIAMIICAIHIVWLILQSWFISGINGSTGEINWNQDVLPFQIIVFSCRLLFNVGFNVLIIVFLIKSLKALKDGTLFPKSNVALLYVTAGCYFIGKLCDDNMGSTLLTETPTCSRFVIETGCILVTLMLIIFAMIYKIAVKVSEENNLTI